jgi:alginate O-acetyltransferase complex protein AlgJ
MTTTAESTRPTMEEWLASAAMLTVMIAGFWQAALSLNSPAVEEIPITVSDFRDGKVTGSLSTQLDKNLPIREDLIAWANAGRYLLTRGAGDQVRLGRDGWLFSVEELQYYDDASSFQNARISILTQSSAALKASDVRLVIALVPDKARMNEQQLVTGSYPNWYRDRYSEIIKNLRANHVEVVDLRPALRSDGERAPFYYRTDTHWNQAGAQRAAASIAKQVKSVVADISHTEFVTKGASPAVQKPGDLLRMMGLSNMPDWTRPQPDNETTALTLKIAAEAKSAGLFDSVSTPVVLVGTSYSLRANFHGYLQETLGADVLNVARDGGGFIQSVKDYLADDSFKTTKPRVIIWEVPERMFSAPLTATEKEPLLF